MSDPLHVLLVEDSAAYASYIREELTVGDGRFVVSHAERVGQAVDRIGAGGIDVILLDLGLPDSGGLATVHRVLAVAIDVPVVVLSGTADDDLATAAVKAGAQDYLVKTQIEAHVLARVIHYAVERRAAAARLRERDAHYRSIVESSLDAIVSIDESGRITEFNPAAESMFGRSRSQVIGEDLADVIIPERLRAQHRAGMARYAATGESAVTDRRREMSGLRADGSEFPVELTISRMSAASPCFIGFIRDLSERRRAQQAQERSLERIAEQASLLDHARDAILVRGLDHRITYFNKSAERMYGWTAADVTGQSVRERFFPDPAVFDAAMSELFLRGDWQGELTVAGRDGGRLTVESRWTLMRDAANRPRAVLVIDTDITERKELERRFLRAQRMESLGTLAGGIAHDLNNVLAPVLMSIELLQDSPSEDERRQILTTIETSARRGAQMVRQVLSFARGVEGERTAIDIPRLLAEVEKIAKDTFVKSITVQTDITGTISPVLGDSTQLHQVLVNLCVNARDAMPNGGALTISAFSQHLDEREIALDLGARAGAYTVVRVADTGTGISPQVIDRMFEPFFTSKPLGQGTGLGLSTSLAIVKSHGGFMRVESELGRGSAFAVYLPARLEEAEAPALAEAAPAEARGNGELVLVVDDEEPLLRMTSLVLEACGYRVLLAANGVEAIAKFREHRAEIAVVLTDMNMPVMDGISVIRQIREITPGVRVIAASGLAAPTAAQVPGVVSFLPKPYTADTLRKAMVAAMRG